MKKVLSILLAGSIASLVACGPSAEEQAAMEKARQDSVAMVQKAYNDSVEAVNKATAEKMKDDSTAAANMEKARKDSMEAASKKKAPMKVVKPTPKDGAAKVGYKKPGVK